MELLHQARRPGELQHCYGDEGGQQSDEADLITGHDLSTRNIPRRKLCVVEFHNKS